jgi:hypothetical protein
LPAGFNVKPLLRTVFHFDHLVDSTFTSFSSSSFLFHFQALFLAAVSKDLSVEIPSPYLSKLTDIEKVANFVELFKSEEVRTTSEREDWRDRYPGNVIFQSTEGLFQGYRNKL